MADSPFDDELTPEEEELLRNDSTVPPAEEEGEGNVDAAIEESKAPAALPKDETKPGEEKPAAADPAKEKQPPAAAEPDEEQELANFLEKHKGKSAEEIARIALQQSKRANREAATNRQTREAVSQMAERARAAAARRDAIAQNAPKSKEDFKKLISEDPDAAVEQLFNGMIDRDVSQADADAQAARFDEAIVFADTHIPNFGKQWPDMAALAKEVGYSDEELDGIDDGRSLIILSLANHTARLMKAGIMDRYGSIVKLPQLQASDPSPTDPRLAAPDPQRTLSGGGRSAASNTSVAEQLAAINAMPEAEFDKFVTENPGVIENLLQQAA